MRRLVTVAAATAAAAALAVPASGARASFDGNACGLLGKAALKSASLTGASCKEYPSHSGTVGALGALTAYSGVYKNTRVRGTHELLLIVVRASNPSAVMAYLRQNKTIFLRQLGVNGVSTRSTAGAAERWFLAGGSYGVYAGLVDRRASKRTVTKALSSIEASVKAGLS